jgi:hypothetical protein
MKKKIVCINAIIVGMLIVLGGLSPAVCSKDIDTVTIEVNRYYGKNSDPIYTSVSIEEAEEIKQILKNLNLAIENNDEEAIYQYEKILNDKGLFGENHQKFFSRNQYTELMEKTNLVKYPKYFGSKNGDNISNTLCYFNAIGEGLMLWWLSVQLWEGIIRTVTNASSPLAGFILFLALLPFLVMVILFTNLIPFRILAPIGIMAFRNGTISSLGLQGFKRLKVGAEGAEVNLSFFTGITINIATSFLFVSGIAFGVKESGT